MFISLNLKIKEIAETVTIHLNFWTTERNDICQDFDIMLSNTLVCPSNSFHKVEFNMYLMKHLIESKIYPSF